MHLFVIARGQRDTMHKWLNALAAQYLPFEHKGLKRSCQLQLGVREVKLLEITFPEESLQEVLQIVRPEHDNALKRLFWPLKRIIGGLEETPEYDRTKVTFGGTNMSGKEITGTGWSFYRVLNDGVRVDAIGIKKDARDETGTELI